MSGFYTQLDWVRIPALPFIGCMISGKSFRLHEPQFPYLKNRDVKTFCLLQRLKAVIAIDCQTPCQLCRTDQ